VTTAKIKAISLSDFLSLPYIEESPAWEYIGGGAIQKPMGGGKHSLLQKRLMLFRTWNLHF
jgi:Uma2 family endonuclease